MTEMEQLHPWEQRDDEPYQAHRGFLAWRDLTGDRTLLRAYRDYIGNRHAAKVPDSFRGWYEEHDWPGRSRAWDRYVRNREDEAQLTAREEAAAARGKTIADLESDLIEAGVETLAAVRKKLNDPDWLTMLTPQQTAPLLRAANETFKNTATFRWLKDGADAEEKPMTQEEEERVDAQLSEIMKRGGELEEDGGDED